MFSILILEQHRNPERDLFLRAAMDANIHVVHEDIRRLIFKSSTTIQTSEGLNINSFSAIVFRTYRDIGLIRQLAYQAKSWGIPILGYDPFRPSAFNDKFEDHLEMERHGVPQPDYWHPSHETVTYATPVVAKRIWGFGGTDVKLIPPGHVFGHPTHEWFAQEYVETIDDWRLYINNGKALPWAIRRQPTEGDFRTNLHQGGFFEVIEKKDVPSFEQLEEVALCAARCLGRAYSGVDIKWKGTIPLVLEVNRTPRIRIGEPYENQLVKAWLSSWMSESQQSKNNVDSYDAHLRFNDAAFLGNA